MLKEHGRRKIALRLRCDRRLWIAGVQRCHERSVIVVKELQLADALIAFGKEQPAKGAVV
jgi:hypothetical protein